LAATTGVIFWNPLRRAAASFAALRERPPICPPNRPASAAVILAFMLSHAAVTVVNAQIKGG
jgi:hypothetical protein